MKILKWWYVGWANTSFPSASFLLCKLSKNIEFACAKYGVLKRTQCSFRENLAYSLGFPAINKVIKKYIRCLHVRRFMIRLFYKKLELLRG